MIFKIAALLFLLSFQIASAQPTLQTIQILGLVRTNPQVIYTELEHCQCMQDETEVEQVLLATGLFYDVSVKSENGTVTAISLKEKWTTIPILKFNSGGGVQQTTLGVYDPNVLGQRIEIGTQYESLAGAPSLVFWNKVPRLFESKFFSDVQIWRTQRTRLKYDPTEKDPILIKALLQKSDRNIFALGYEWDPALKTKLGIEIQDDSFSTDRIPNDTLNKVTGQVIPEDSKVNFLSSQIEYGKLKTIRHSPVGWLSTANLKFGLAQSSNQNNFQTLRAESVYFKMSDDFLLAGRLQIGSTNTDLIHHWNYLGGFESIRGFVDNRFATKNYWLINFESRYFLIEKEKYILQATSFADSIGINEASNKIENMHAASVGAGARLILPHFYRLIIRLDLAFPVIKSDTQRVSFGVQQFF
jgi:outer membrane protein assembly factor BamA